MDNNTMLKLREFLIRNIVILMFLPLIAFIFIFTTYGTNIEQELLKDPESAPLYKFSFIKSTISSTSGIPAHIKILSNYLIIFCYVLFTGWLLSFVYYSYYNLSRNSLQLPMTIIEFILLISVFQFMVVPNLAELLSILGYVVFAFVLFMLLVYKEYYKKQKHEKE